VVLNLSTLPKTEQPWQRPTGHRYGCILTCKPFLYVYERSDHYRQILELTRDPQTERRRRRGRANFFTQGGVRSAAVAYETILVECTERIGLITLNRPERRNAYTARMRAELADAFGELEADGNVRAIVVTGAGKHLCAGADLGSGGTTFNRLSDDEARGRHRERATAAPRPWEMRTPIIAAINGAAVGIGITLPMQWDIRIVAKDARLGFVFNRRGVTPEANSTWIVPRLVGVSRAMELLLTGRMFDGVEAVEMGLASQAVDADQVLPTAMAIARDIAQNVAPLSAAITKRLVYRFLSEANRNAAHALESQAFSWIGSQADAREGVTAFLEKRAPDWKLSKHTQLAFEV
jgi:enoyl-CoA hydratase/carnithine racemase